MVSAERLPDVTPPPLRDESGLLEAYLEDASGRSPGRARGLVRPRSEQEAAAFLRTSREQGLTILPQAACNIY